MDLQRQILSLKVSLLRYRIHTINQRQRRFGVREIFKRRDQQGDGVHLINEMRIEDPEMFFNYTRMDKQMFNNLLAMVGPHLKKRNICTRLTEIQRLAITLRFLAAGDSLGTLSFAYRCAKSTVSIIIKEALPAIASVLEPLYVKAPSSPEEWKAIAEVFYTKWNLPHCVGAIDGKHITIQSPKASGSLFFNYKKSFSMVLLAACDANYCFTVTDIGAEGSNSDATVFRDSAFGKNLVQNKLHLPSPTYLPNSNLTFPFFFVGDAAFPLKENLMKPYSTRNLTIKEAVFNYRLSRARRVIENTFGILAARWRILRRPFCASTSTSHNTIRAVVALHNYIKKSQNCAEIYCPPNFVDNETENGDVLPGDWRSILHEDEVLLTSCSSVGSRNAMRSTLEQRKNLTDYLVGPGQVSWQMDKVRSGFWGAVAIKN